MSDYTVQMEAQSPARSPEPLHQRPLPERPFALPISPQSALVALSLADGDEEALKSLSQSLITTIQKHTKEVRQTNDAKDARIRELEQKLGGFLPVFVAPDGYVENDDSRAQTSTSPSKTATSNRPIGSNSWTTDKSPPSLKNTPSPTHHTSVTSTPAYTVPTTAMKTPSYPCSRGSSNYSPAPPTVSTRYTRRPRGGSTGRLWQRYSASENWNTPLLTHSAASTFSKPKYGAQSKPKMHLKDAWKQRASIAPWATSAPYPTWGGGTSGSSGRTLRRGSSIVNEDIDI